MWKYIKTKLEERKKKKLKQQLIVAVKDVLRFEPDSGEVMLGLQNSSWQLSNTYSLTRSRMKSGDIVEIIEAVNGDRAKTSWFDRAHAPVGTQFGITNTFGWLDDKVRVYWVDQSCAANALLGTNGVFFNSMDIVEMQLILQLLKDKNHGACCKYLTTLY